MFVPRNLLFLFYSVLLCASFVSTQANADPPLELETVIVTASTIGNTDAAYGPVMGTSATKTSSLLKELPLSVGVVEREVIQDKNITSPNQLADLASGIQPLVGYGSSPSALYVIRGFSTVGVNYRNGFRLLEPYNPRDVANVERVEFIKGPSLLYGAGQPGGSVNMVTKVPLAESFLHIKQNIGSYDTYRTTIDANHTLGEVSFRLNGAVSHSQSYLDFFEDENLFAAPIVQWDITDDTSLLYEGEFQKYSNSGWSNGLPNTRDVLNAPFSVNVNDSSSYFDNITRGHRVEFKHKLNNSWELRERLYFDDTNRSYLNAQPYWGSTTTTFDRMTFYAPHEGSRNGISQSEFYGKLATGNVRHDIVAGFEASRNIWEYTLATDDQYDTDGNLIGTGLGTFDLFNPDYSQKPVPIEPNFAQRNILRSHAFYAQDSISWDNWRFLAGARNDRIRSRVKDTLSDSPALQQTENALTGRAGAMYLVTPATGIYYSVSQSFNPNFTARNANNEVFDAERGIQHETGIKQTILDGLELTAALYQITKKNVLVNDPDNPGFSKTNGEQRSRGLEVGLSGRICEELHVISNITLQDAEVTKTTPGDSTPVGTKLVGVPKTSANIWSLYDLPITDIPGKLSIGAGIVYSSQREGVQPNTDFTLPSYVRYEGGLFYNVGQYHAALNLHNISDKKYLETVEGALTQIAPPFTATVTIGVDF